MLAATFPNIDVPGAGLLHAKFDTSHGEIVAVLEEERAPKTVRNFVGLALGTQAWLDPRTRMLKTGERFYDNTVIHRVIPGFVIHGGDRLGTGMASAGYRFANEFHPELRHSRAGILSMAQAAPNCVGSQFFITDGPCPWLDSVHSVFGAVVEGLAVVNAIGRLASDERDRPTKPVSVRSVSVFRRAV